MQHKLQKYVEGYIVISSGLKENKINCILILSNQFYLVVGSEKSFTCFNLKKYVKGSIKLYLQDCRVIKSKKSFAKFSMLWKSMESDLYRYIFRIL